MVYAKLNDKFVVVGYFLYICRKNIMEKWKTIKDYPNYKISNKGRVLSFKNDKTNGELLEPRKVPAKLYKEEQYG